MKQRMRKHKTLMLILKGDFILIYFNDHRPTFFNIPKKKQKKKHLEFQLKICINRSVSTPFELFTGIAEKKTTK